MDARLLAVVIKVVDIAYGGENGFNQAIELAAETLSNVKLVQEKKLITCVLARTCRRQRCGAASDHRLRRPPSPPAQPLF